MKRIEYDKKEIDNLLLNRIGNGEKSLVNSKDQFVPKLVSVEEARTSSTSSSQQNLGGFEVTSGFSTMEEGLQSLAIATNIDVSALKQTAEVLSQEIKKDESERQRYYEKVVLDAEESSKRFQEIKEQTDEGAKLINEGLKESLINWKYIGMIAVAGVVVIVSYNVGFLGVSMSLITASVDLIKGMLKSDESLGIIEVSGDAGRELVGNFMKKNFKSLFSNWSIAGSPGTVAFVKYSFDAMNLFM